MVQRRCVQRQLLMRPCEAVNNLFWYCLIHAATVTHVEVIAAMMMSNHYHLVLRDKRGQLPLFFQRFNSLLARSLNCFRGRWENVWAAHEQTSTVALESFDDIVAKTIYTYANPVAAHLVESVTDWPGASSWSARRERVISANRPDFFFDQNEWPETATLELYAPPQEGDDGAAFVAAVKRGVRAAEDDYRDQRRKGRTGCVMGHAAVLRQRWDGRPATHEPRRRLSPRVACQSKWHRIEALQRNRQWLNDYALALADWREGRRVKFPPGTWLMSRFDRAGPS